MNIRHISWAAATCIAISAFVYGAVDQGAPRTNSERVHLLAQNFACPVCAGQSVAESDVPVARQIRRQISVWVDEGRADDYIEDQLVASYNNTISYTPSTSGLTGLVWILPVVIGSIAVAVMITVIAANRARAYQAHDPADTPTHTHAHTQIPTHAQAQTTPIPTTHKQTTPMQAVQRVWWVWAAVIVVVCGVAGMFLTQFSANRYSGESITGDISRSTRELIFQAQQSIQNGDITTAIANYDKVLELQPSNVEALTYKGWLESRNGNTEQAVVYLDDAISLNPEYSDVRLFRAFVAFELGDIVKAAVELARFDELDNPPYARQLLEDSQIRTKITSALMRTSYSTETEMTETQIGEALQEVDRIYRFATTTDVSTTDTSAGDLIRHSFTRPGFKDSRLSIEDVLVVSDALFSQGRLLDAVQLLDWVLMSHPNDAEVLTSRGWLLVKSGEAQLIERGIIYIDEALAAEPSNLRAQAYRASTKWHSENIR